MCLASEKDHKKDVLHCTTPIILPLCFCVYEKSKISVYICSYWYLSLLKLNLHPFAHTDVNI